MDSRNTISLFMHSDSEELKRQNRKKKKKKYSWPKANDMKPLGKKEK